ncbi:DUF4381 domain-containing protein [Uliginosibacterium sp. H3]|uniref:DUF4381 domain-containing protein n=1 Tax=Uliginosibacterium silvisoli TaxID=3114758 RepID=A0ABU6K264_9RHOO|nr:DUF4381 domain-containing protein [Uliginosibacterium sp. H3]
MADLVRTTADGVSAPLAESSAPLAGLKEIPLPLPPAWTPQTWGWLVVAALLLLAIAWLGWWLYRRHVANRYRAEALGELARLEQVLNGPATAESAAARGRALGALPALVKRVVLAFAPRERVAALSDAEWLAFLDRTTSGQPFTQGAGKLLPSLAYDPRPPSATDLQALIALLRNWIARHHAAV